MFLQKNWHTIIEIFDALNSGKCNYLVMRNYECFNQGEVFVNNHNDIDLLCDDIKLVKKILNTRKRFLFPTVNSYYILYNNQKVYVDIRFVGDGYYDTTWQKDMLKNKIKVEPNIFVMDNENYFYSLIYHALFQKDNLSEEYRIKLIEMSKKLCHECKNEKELLALLYKYLETKKYKMTITRDPAIILNTKAGYIPYYEKKQYFWILKRFFLNKLKKIKRIGDKYV